MSSKHYETTKESLIEEIKRRQEDKIIEKSNADLLIKLIDKADDLNEAINIATLGTTYKRTGFHFDKRLEKMDRDIKYFKKNEELSFSDGSDKPANKLIVGDNYEALQNLLIEYKGKVDVIYIDPPYGKDSMGEFAQTNYDNAITRDNLLSMLYSRLVLAKELLSDTGVIFCSIDDKNQAYVKCLFDEVFGEQNFIAIPVRRKNKLVLKGDNTFKNVLEYLLIYSKNKKNIVFEYSKEEISDSDFSMISSGYGIKTVTFTRGQFKFKIEKGIVKKGIYGNIELNNDIEIKNYENMNDFSAIGEFKWQEDTIQNKLKNGYYVLVNNVKKFSPRIHKVGNTSKPLDYIDETYGLMTNEDGKTNITEIFGEIMFDYPKPVDYIKFLLNIKNDESAIVVDFFAGSGTTGHATLQMNEEDNGNRKFILVQLDEDLDKALEKAKDTNAKETLKNQIKLCDELNRPHKLSEITAERLRRVMTGKSLTGKTDFEWLKKNEPYGGTLEVCNIERIADTSDIKGRTPFDVIDETLYGQKKFENVNDKIKWVCENFEHTEKYIESEEEYVTRSH